MTAPALVPWHYDIRNTFLTKYVVILTMGMPLANVYAYE